jgi:hypothetical protein
LNSSNDLFLTFRKEMEEMSKKTKRLEKENLSLTRKHEATNQSIIKMAEERTRAHKEMGKLIRKNENLEKLCRGMQAQGRGIAAAGAGAGGPHEDAASASEYDDEVATAGGAASGVHYDCPLHGAKQVHDHTCIHASHGGEDGDDEFDGEDEDERAAPQDDGAEDSDALPAVEKVVEKAAPVGKVQQLTNGAAAAGVGAKSGGKRGAAAPASKGAGANGVKH